MTRKHVHASGCYDAAGTLHEACRAYDAEKRDVAADPAAAAEDRFIHDRVDGLQGVVQNLQERVRALEPRSFKANERLDAIEELLDDQARLHKLQKEGARLFDAERYKAERGYARDLAMAEQRLDEALALLRDYDEYDNKARWMRSRDLFLERLKRAPRKEDA